MSSSSSLSFKFGNYLSQSEGVVDILLSLMNGTYSAFKAHFVPADVPMLIGSDLLSKHSLILDFHVGVITQKGGDWRIPMAYKWGHVFVD